MNISKELFEAVTKQDWEILEVTDYYIKTKHTDIPVNDFFFKCKEWAYENGFDIWSITWGACEVESIKNYSATKRFEADSEQQAVFDACQYILENK